MDPITGAILAALAAGVVGGATEIGKKVIVDAYDALKATLKKKHGEDSKVVQAVVELEEDKESKGRQLTLEEQVAKAKAPEDPELVNLAEALKAALDKTTEGKAALSKYNLTIQNSEVGVIGDNAKIEGGIHFGDKK